MEPIRLNKYLTERGVMSRRQADSLAEEGRILVNGEKAVPGMRVTDEDEILFDGKPVSKEIPKRVVLAVNKPVGVVCTARSFRGEDNIVDMVSYETRLYPVGRLDKESQGLIFLTNDGNLAKELTDAAGKHEKEYEVTVSHELTDSFLKRMEKGIYLEDLDRQTAACKIVKTGEKKFRITLVQGLNRQIRRMCEVCGYNVITLKRIRIMNVLLGDLEEGNYRPLGGEELAVLLQKMQEDKLAKPAPRNPRMETGDAVPEHAFKKHDGSRRYANGSFPKGGNEGSEERSFRRSEGRKTFGENGEKIRSGERKTYHRLSEQRSSDEAGEKRSYRDRATGFKKNDSSQNRAWKGNSTTRSSGYAGRENNTDEKRPAGFTKRERTERFERSGESMKPTRNRNSSNGSSYIPKRSGGPNRSR